MRGALTMMRRGIYHGVFGALFDDVDFQKLTAKARHVLLTLRLCNQCGPACIFRFYPQVVAQQTGYTPKVVEASLHELEERPHPEDAWVVRDDVVLWVRNGLRFDPHMSLADPRHIKTVLRAIAGLPHTVVVDRFVDYYDLSTGFKELTNRFRLNSSPSQKNGWPRGKKADQALLDLDRVPSTETEEAREPSTEIRASNALAPALLSDDQFIEGLRMSPAYLGVDIDRELAKMDNWLRVNPGRRKTRRFIVNWLNKVERPVMLTPHANGVALAPRTARNMQAAEEVLRRRGE